MSRNYIRNPDFTLPSQTLLRLSGAGAKIAPAWYAGPGAGGVVDVTFPAMPMANLAAWGFRRNPLRYLEMNWLTAPTVSDNDSAHGMPRPTGGWTFLEHMMGANSCDLMGKTVNYYFRAVCFSDKPQCRMVPIIEVNRKAGDYTLYPQQAADINASGWGTVYGSFTIPQFSAVETIDNTFYVAFDLDVDGLSAPHFALADFALWTRGTLDDVESRPYELEALIAI